MNRREMLSLVAATGISSPIASATGRTTPTDPPPFQIIDTNVSLFRWPFRRLPLDETKTQVAKLRSLGITNAWAGSFEGLLHRDIRSVNDRLVAECRNYGELTPVGSVNPVLPGWEADFSRCLNEHAMKVIRLHPGYHGYELSDSRFHSLLKHAGSAGCIVQIAVAMEDPRTQHDQLRVADVDLAPLPKAMGKAKSARVQLLNYRPRRALIEKLGRTPGVYFDTARIDGTDGIPDLVRALPPGRVVFGSHSPFLIPEAALIRVHESDQLDEDTLRQIYFTNSASLASGQA